MDQDVEYMDLDDPDLLRGIAFEVKTMRSSADNLFTLDNVIPVQETDDSDKLSIRSARALVIIDTNFCLTHLGFLHGLVYRSAPSNGVVVIVPWIVIQELDGLKSRSSKSQIREIAIRANDFLWKALGSKRDQSSLRGQKLNERLREFGNKNKSNDDEILNCCRYFQQAVDHNIMVMLLSNDKNLCVKALVHGIETFSYFKNGLDPDTVVQTILHQSTQRKGMNNVPAKNEKPNANKAADISLKTTDDIDFMDADKFSSESTSLSNSYTTQMPNEASTHNDYPTAKRLKFDSNRFTSNTTADFKDELESMQTDSELPTVSLVSTDSYDSIHAPERSLYPRSSSITATLIPYFPADGPQYTLPNQKAIERIINEICMCLEQALPQAMEFHYINAFGEHWTYVLEKDLPPWPLKKALSLIQRHDFTVFQQATEPQALGRLVRSAAEGILNFMRNYEKPARQNMLNMGQMQKFLTNVEVILAICVGARVVTQEECYYRLEQWREMLWKN
ncbi:uncharacterized protein VTP21DRAFT_7814 [Calcarisporiella thermophila]|uniref:uncharacterized protein n=1 Tax=Calcarisporiella thermophila TaxID=911321 RepID=UPI0037436262